MVYLLTGTSEVPHGSAVFSVFHVPIDNVDKGIDLIHDFCVDGRFQAGKKQDKWLELLLELTERSR